MFSLKESPRAKEEQINATHQGIRLFEMPGDIEAGPVLFKERTNARIRQEFRNPFVLVFIPIGNSLDDSTALGDVPEAVVTFRK